MCLQGAVFLRNSIESVVSIERLPENVSFSTASEAADESLRLLRACGNIHEDMHKPVDKFEDGTFPCFSYMVY